MGSAGCWVFLLDVRVTGGEGVTEPGGDPGDERHSREPAQETKINLEAFALSCWPKYERL